MYQWGSPLVHFIEKLNCGAHYAGSVSFEKILIRIFFYITTTITKEKPSETMRFFERFSSIFAEKSGN